MSFAAQLQGALDRATSTAAEALPPVDDAARATDNPREGDHDSFERVAATDSCIDGQPVGDVAKRFMQASEWSRSLTLQQLDEAERELLLESLREHFVSAGDGGSKDASAAATLAVAVFILRDSAAPDSAKQEAARTVAKCMAEAGESTLRYLNALLPADCRQAIVAGLRELRRDAGDPIWAQRSLDALVVVEARALVEAQPAEREQILAGSDAGERAALLGALRELYGLARDNPSLERTEAAIVALAVHDIRSEPGFDGTNTRDTASRVLQYMHNHVGLAQDDPDAAPRDAATWEGSRVLAEGNANGCVESARLFQLLMNGVSDEADTRYVSSFSLAGANAIKAELAKPAAQRNQALINDPPGHALVEVYDRVTGERFLVDGSMFPDPLIGVSLSEEELQRSRELGDRTVTGAILQYPDRNDVLVERTEAGIRVSVCPFGQLGEATETFTFAAIDEAEAFLSQRFGSLASFEQLEEAGVIRHESDGTYEMAGGTYVIFDRQEACPFEDQYGENGSSTLTLAAIRNYFGI
jgi:hypothetical protein